LNAEFDPSWPIHRVASRSKLYLSTSGSVVPTSIWQLPNLQFLHLADIENVSQLPDKIPPTATLPALRIGQSRLTNLPDTITRLASLRSLSSLTSLSTNSARLQQLPDQITQFSSLRVLNLSYSLARDVALRSGLEFDWPNTRE
jgi:Leucine-rich repeat (LRR) protein